METMDIEDLENFIKGSVIERLYKPYSGELEGGLTIIFTKDDKKGIVIFGYTELGEWVEYFEYDSEIFASSKYGKDDYLRIKRENCLK